MLLWLQLVLAPFVSMSGIAFVLCLEHHMVILQNLVAAYPRDCEFLRAFSEPLHPQCPAQSLVLQADLVKICQMIA